MKILRANSLKTSHDLLVQWQNQQNKRKWSNVDGLFVESFLCFLVSLDRVTDIKTKTFFCNTSNRDYVHNSSLSGGCSSVFSSVSIPILFSSWAFCSEADCVSSESHDVTKERALLMAPPAIEKDLWPRKEWFLFEAFHIGQSQYAPIIKWTHLLQNSEKNKRGRRRGREKRVLPCYEWFNFWLVEKLAGIFLVNHQA